MVEYVVDYDENLAEKIVERVWVDIFNRTNNYCLSTVLEHEQDIKYIKVKFVTDGEIFLTGKIMHHYTNCHIGDRIYAPLEAIYTPYIMVVVNERQWYFGLNGKPLNG